jgi:enamine deaminase RidA (YjgF/YER057c/UK114 family)
MTRHLISSGSSFEHQIGYSRAVVSGDWVFVSGCTGYDYSTSRLPPSIEAQTEQCMRNIDFALREAGSSINDVVRARYILPDRNDFGPPVWEVLKKWFGDVRPAATMVVAGLMEEEMRIEIEVTARMGRSGGDVEEGGVAGGP